MEHFLVVVFVLMAIACIRSMLIFNHHKKFLNLALEHIEHDETSEAIHMVEFYDNIPSYTADIFNLYKWTYKQIFGEYRSTL